MRKIYTSVDIGTDEIRVVTVEKFNDRYNVLASSSFKSSGLKKGLITDAQLVSGALKKAIRNNENKLGVKINKVLAIVPSKDSYVVPVVGTTLVKEEDGIVTGNHIFSCLQNALANSAENGMEVVSVLPKAFLLDKKTIVSNPIGKKCNILSVKAVSLLVPKKNVYSVVSVLESLGIEVMDISVSGIANYFVIKNRDFDAKNVAIVDIGVDKTNISIFSEGVIKEDIILPIGGKSIDTDISSTYNFSVEDSKKLKEDYSVCNRKYADSEEFEFIIGGKREKLYQYKLAELIETRVVDILKNIKIQINNLTNGEIGYIMITGGITSMLGFNALVEDVFVKNASVMNIGILGVRDNRYSASYGLIKYFVSKLELREKEYTMFSMDRIDAMLSPRKKAGNNVIGKIFDRLFD